MMPHPDFAPLYMHYGWYRFFIYKAIAKRLMLQKESTITALHYYVHFAFPVLVCKRKRG